LKFQATLIGPRVVFAGTGPLLYLVAWQYASHGGEVAAVLDTAPLSAKLRAAPGMLARPAVAAKGAYFLARLRLMGIAVHGGATLVKAEGQSRVTSLTWHAGGEMVRTDCDAIGFGHGLRSETQLADLAGCAFDWNEIDQAWLPVRYAGGRSSVRGVYLAGDGAGILGADAAEISGATAAQSALDDMGERVATPTARAVPEAPGASAQIVSSGPGGHRDPVPHFTGDPAMQPHVAFRRALETAFAPPPRWAAEAPDDLIV